MSLGPINNNSLERIVLQSQKAMDNDGRIDRKELTELKKLINSSDLPKEIKDGAIKFIQEANKASTGFLFFGGGDISAKELGKLKTLASSMPNNPLAQKLSENLEDSVDNINAAKEENRVTKHKSDGFKNHFSFPTFKRKPSNPISSVQAGEATSNLNKFYVTQNGNGLSTGGRDCGPASASMILKQFGYLGSTSSRDSVTAARNAGNNSSTAFSEDNIADAVKNLSDGAVKMVDEKRWGKTGATQASKYIAEQLADGKKPILLTGSPFSSSRHYMVPVSVKNDGTVIVADPALPGQKLREISPKELTRLMGKTDRGSAVLVFDK